jgi:RimJ/RimL family protein N-acetyltransferase
MTTLTTERLVLRPVELRDVDLLARQQASPEVMRYVPGGIRTRAQVLALVERSIADWRAQGHGLFAVEHQEIHEVIGYCGTRALEQGALIELDMILAEEHWTQGLGTEAAAAVIASATQAGVQHALAVPHDANVAAHRVCEKNELASRGSAKHYGIECAVYALGG